MKNKIIPTLLLAPLYLFANPANTVEQLFNVQTIEVKPHTVNLSKTFSGYTRLNQKNIYDISPRYSGYVEKLYADNIYMKIKKGDKLMKVYSKEVFKSKEEYLNSSLFKDSINSGNILNSAKLKLQLLNVSDKEIDEILVNKKTTPYTYIYSPIDGYLFLKNINNGSSFKEYNKVLSIADLKDIWVEISLFEQDRKILEKSNNFTISFKGIDKIYKSSDFKLYPNINPDSPTLTARINMDNQDNKLIPGMYAQIKIHTIKETYLTVPVSSIIRKNSKQYVFIVGEYEGEYEPVEVQAVKIDDDTYKIISGIEEGDMIVNNSLFMMDSDAQINGLY